MVLHNHTIEHVFFGKAHMFGGDSWCCFMQLLGPYFLFYSAEVTYVGTEKTKVCFGVTVQLWYDYVINLNSKQMEEQNVQCTSVTGNTAFENLP